jgi:hypothetical protein
MTERRGVYRAGKSSEHQQQATVIAWARSRETARPELALLFAVPNAGKRSVRLAAYMRAEGLKAGVPDLWLPVARRGYHGLVIEMKWGDNTTTEEQERWLVALDMQGNKPAFLFFGGVVVAPLHLNVQAVAAPARNWQAQIRDAGLQPFGLHVRRQPDAALACVGNGEQ